MTTENSNNCSHNDPKLKYFKPDEIDFTNQLVSALQAKGMKKESMRLEDCGSMYNAFTCENVNTQQHKDRHKHKGFLFSYRCELRICPRCTRKRGFDVRKQAQEITNRIDKTTTHKFALLTLTKKKYEGEELTKKSLQRFNQNVRKLINRYYPKDKKCGALAVMEIGPQMNIHSHILVYGPYLDQKMLSRAWKDITGDSYVVDIRAVRDAKVAISYTTKYIMKPPKFDKTESYVQFLKALKGVRRLHRYGIMYGFRIMLREPSKCPYCGGTIVYSGVLTELASDYLPFYFDLNKESEKNEK